jgi:hypothetical protein
MPPSARALYYQLGVEADDDGFIDPYVTMLATKSQDDDLKILIAKGFVISFETGVVVIRHWKRHNYIRKDRYTQTQYLKEFRSMQEDESGDYFLLEGEVVNQRLPQDRKGKDRLGKVENSQNYLLDIPDQDVKEFTSTYSCSERQLKSKGEDLHDYCQAHGKRYKDYKALLRNAIKKDFGLKRKNDYDKYKDVEINGKNIEKLKEIKKQKGLT